MTISNNPLLVAQVNVYAVYLTRTGERDLNDGKSLASKLHTIIAKDDRSLLWDFANEHMNQNTSRMSAGVSAGEIDGRRAMAEQIVTILKFA